MLHLRKFANASFSRLKMIWARQNDFFYDEGVYQKGSSFTSGLAAMEKRQSIPCWVLKWKFFYRFSYLSNLRMFHWTLVCRAWQVTALRFGVESKGPKIPSAIFSVVKNVHRKDVHLSIVLAFCTSYRTFYRIEAACFYFFIFSPCLNYVTSLKDGGLS